MVPAPSLSRPIGRLEGCLFQVYKGWRRQTPEPALNPPGDDNARSTWDVAGDLIRLVQSSTAWVRSVVALRVYEGTSKRQPIIEGH